MGRLRALLRLGKRADARSPRRPFLATHGGTRERPGSRAWLRHRTRDHSRRAHGRARRRPGSIVGDAVTRAEAIDAGTPRQARLVDPRRHPVPAISQVSAFRSRDGAIRHSAVARPRVRSQGDAGRRRASARAGWPFRYRSGAGSAGLEGVPQPGAVSRIAPRRQVAHHAGRIGPAGSREETDDFRSEVRGAERPRAAARGASRSCSAPSRCRR